MPRTYCFFDSEFTRISNPKLRCVSSAVLYLGKITSWWTDDEEGKRACIKFFKELDREVIIVCFNVESEARFMISIGLDPREYKWQCLYLEYLMIRNHNHEILYGKQLVEGEVKKLRPYQDEKGGASLVCALYKMCEIRIDSERKDKMRDLIISDPDIFTEEQKVEILEYNESDIVHLPALQKAIASYIMKKLPKKEHAGFFEESLRRADYAVETAYMVSRGYPINVKWAKNFTENIEPLLDLCIRDINSQFPGFVPFSYNKKTDRWKANQSTWRQWIRDNKFEDGWALTKGGTTGTKNLSLALEAWTERFPYTHSYPRNNFGAQIVRYLKLKQSVGGFREKAGRDKKSFWEYVGPDGRVRPYFNIFNSQSSRSQPSATSYIFLKPAFQRTLVHPPKRKMIVAIDYVSEEVLLGALLSGDAVLLRDYNSGDIYLAYGKTIGMIPKDGTKKTHKYERDLQKPVILGWQYWMTGHGLSRNLTEQTGKEWTVEDAQEKLDQLDETYETFAEFRKGITEEYDSRRYVRLRDGWTMFGDNHNFRSVGNVGTQGAGADIMRRAVMECTARKLEVIFTLHDALYIEVDVGDWASVDKFVDAMLEGFTSYFKGTTQYENSKSIRVDTYAWGDGLEEKEIKTPNGHTVSTMPIYIDERAVDEYEHFKQFFFEESGIDAL